MQQGNTKRPKFPVFGQYWVFKNCEVILEVFGGGEKNGILVGREGITKNILEFVLSKSFGK